MTKKILKKPNWSKIAKPPDAGFANIQSSARTASELMMNNAIVKGNILYLQQLREQKRQQDIARFDLNLAKRPPKERT